MSTANRQTSNAMGNARRAFRDVTNSARNMQMDARGGGKANVHKKMHHAPIARAERSMVSEVGVTAAFGQHQGVQVHNNFEVPHEQPPVLPHHGSSSSMNVDSHSYQNGQADNIDLRDADDPLCATDYVQEMYSHFREKENLTSVRPIYMESQSHINERMRSILVDWLVEVHLKFKLVPETLYLTVNLIDRYLERKEVSRPTLQLIGVTSLLIASKYEEIYPPELRDLVYICDRAYSKREILDMEENILRTLKYKITIPSAHAFLVRNLKAAHADKRIVQLSCYILDGTLQSYNLLHYLPSQLAAAAVFIARRSVGRNSWSPTLLRYAAYREEDIIPVARAILAEKGTASNELRAVNKKYTSSRYGGVANTSLHSDF
uniref:Cyclin N-terminal domain-containing protein n=1 Tax=Attheya septentrionalis TaxID=420275 RepID=A0A7S2UBL8_9STRA|mmetsp:Transcript_18041/g.32710  ORF Transcript_18041/g.32710 Transcript_18041/m.32710 type:complete len:377 (+) Transcript_18041:195-1325(+)|eukprot:CAMPEP_0198294280 /NCGR_PEP_ID=MMETSP1449-20131203/21561_1 /TAXON_ID=420275 /ORGANISM="Attheya septentrionalis, Strain CCMP2084" /LENGTH=376 /DNA_ID=CAMNT_0043994185 /DNA_START=180 /DNA_END=1310 /DNA_ORIENTATION=+